MSEITLNSIVQHADYDLLFRVVGLDECKQKAEIQCDNILGLCCSIEKLIIVQGFKSRLKTKPKKNKASSKKNKPSIH